jgi:hypothetical protein
MRKRSTKLWLTVLPFACALFVVAGCGGDGEPDTDDADPIAEAPERPGDGPEDEAADEAAPEELGGAADRALEACRQLMERVPGIPEQTKREVIADCEAAASGDEEAIRTATRAACDVVAAATAPPLLRGQVADACKRAIPGGGAGI